MNKTVIHVGLHKTATTYLQENVWPEIPGYTYLSRPYTQLNHAFNKLQYADDTLYNKDLVIHELEKIAADRLLISDESFSGKPVYFSYLNRSIIAKRLKELFPNAEIILFLRDQRDIIMSHYSSYIRTPYGTKRIEDLFYRPRDDYRYTDYLKSPEKYDLSCLYYNTNDIFIHLDCFMYSNLVGLYSDLFDKCHVFLYEDFLKNNEASISRLERIVEEKIHVKSSRRINVSLSFTEIEKKRKENLIASTITNKYLCKLSQAAVYVTSTVRVRDLKMLVNEIVGEYYSEDNQVLKKLLSHAGWDNHPDKYT